MIKKKTKYNKWSLKIREPFQIYDDYCHNNYKNLSYSTANNLARLTQKRRYRKFMVFNMNLLLIADIKTGHYRHALSTYQHYKSYLKSKSQLYRFTRKVLIDYIESKLPKKPKKLG